MDKNLLDVCSVNCNGLGDDKKRVEIFQWLKRKYKGVMLLQETYNTEKREHTWGYNIGHQYKCYFSHGSSNSRGVATVIPKNLVPNVINVDRDTCGHLLLVQVKIEENIYSMLNVYFPTQNEQKEQIKFLHDIENIIGKYPDSNFIIGGDFNIISNPLLDKWNPISEKLSPAATRLKQLKENLNLIDIW